MLEALSFIISSSQVPDSVLIFLVVRDNLGHVESGEGQQQKTRDAKSGWHPLVQLAHHGWVLQPLEVVSSGVVLDLVQPSLDSRSVPSEGSEDQSQRAEDEGDGEDGVKAVEDLSSGSNELFVWVW